MEWNLMNPIGLVETEIGFLVNGIYIVSDDCEEALEEIMDLVMSDGNDASVRHQVLQQNLIHKDLVPLMLALEDDSPLMENAIKLLSLLTQPLDFLTGPHASGTVEQRCENAVIGLLQQAGDICWNVHFITKVIKQEIDLRLNRDENCTLNPKDCETINYLLLLIRNLFYYTERENDSQRLQSHQRLLFESGIDQVLLAILRHPQKILFTVSVVQILSFLFKGHEKYLYKSISASSSGPVFPLLEMDSHVLPGLKTISPQQTDVHKDIVIVSQQTDVQNETENRMELIDSIMDSMELRKPGGATEEGAGEGEWNSNMINSAEMVLSETELLGLQLQKFLKQFLAENYTSFIADLLKIAMSSSGKFFDNHYLIWSLSFFLRFANDHNCYLPDLLPSIDVNLISYLVYVMVDCTEKLQSLQQQKQTCDQTHQTHQKLHLTVLSLLNLFRLMTFSIESPYLHTVIPVETQESLAKMSELHEVFLLLLRQHQCNQHGKSYLKDVIISNHHLLLLLEKWGAQKLTSTKFSMLDHIKKFATVDTMGKYGHALENFDSNESSLNDSILTMMHHVAGDCSQPRSLMQLSIMRTFTNIWDKKHILSQEFNDLIEFVMEQFMGLAEQDPILSAQMLFGPTESMDTVGAGDNDKEETTPWSDEETEILMSSILNLQESDNIPKDLRYALGQCGIDHTEDEIESYIRQMGWLPSDMMMMADEVSRDKLSPNEEKKMEIIEELTQVPQEELVEYIVGKMHELDNQPHLQWLQDNLFQSAEAKLYFMHNSIEKIGEPVKRICTLLKKDFPIIMVTEEQEKICHNIYFFALLNEIGLKPPLAEESQAFWRVPFEWVPSDIIEKAQLLGPVSFDKNQFSQEEDLAYLFSSATSLSPSEDTIENEQSSAAKDVKVPDSEWMSCIQQVNKLQVTQTVRPATMDVN